MLAVLADVECRYSSARRRLSSSNVEPLRRESKIIGLLEGGEGMCNGRGVERKYEGMRGSKRGEIYERCRKKEKREEHGRRRTKHKNGRKHA